MAQHTALLAWSDTQGNILTGGGQLQRRSALDRDFEEADLPHYLLKTRKTRQTFVQWIEQNHRDFAIVGSWSRPIFAGGWKESTDLDTEAFNLQTPSLFIDMRIPIAPEVRRALRTRGSLSNCTDLELRLLARQHTFSGYSLPEVDATKPLHFIRHHIIDWNYHPSFPRPRPNKWWIQTDKATDASSFKEFSFVRDENNIPVYFERWDRRPGDGGGKKYLALRKRTGCPAEAKRLGLPQVQDAMLIVVGNHFALAVDRPQPAPTFLGAPGPGGPALVDHALLVGDRAAAEQYLNLEGSFGQLLSGDSDSVEMPDWKIVRSTHPWREGARLFESSLGVSGDVGYSDTVRLSWKGRGTQRELSSVLWRGFEWDALECNYTERELHAMFPVDLHTPVSRL